MIYIYIYNYIYIYICQFYFLYHLDLNSYVVYLDLRKAFDCVPHRRLLSKLRSYGVAGNLFDWIENFLTNKKQRVCIRGSFSEWVNITSGVPQGSVLDEVLGLHV